MHGHGCVIAEGVSLLNGADAFVFHQPYFKLVMKSFARLMLNDFLSDPSPDYKGKYAGLEAFRLVAVHLYLCVCLFLSLSLSLTT